MSSYHNISSQIKSLVLSSGFDLVGISQATKLNDNEYLQAWIDKDYQGEMTYMEDVQKRSDVRKINKSFKSVITCGINYNSIDNDNTSKSVNETTKGWISRYATGDDYHKLLEKKLKRITFEIKNLFPFKIEAKYYVDTGPILERAYASNSGVGWIGKNSCLINKDIGSWIFLSEILIDQALDYDEEIKDMCGTCTRCIDACPTKAIISEKVIDSNKCISYLNIENKKYIDSSLANKFVNNIYGCDICQEICPWNRKAKLTDLKTFNTREDLISPDLLNLLDQIENNWDTFKINSPMKRVKQEGLIRNILIVLGNSSRAEYIPILKKYLNSKNKIHAKTAEDSIRRLSSLISS